MRPDERDYEESEAELMGYVNYRCPYCKRRFATDSAIECPYCGASERDERDAE